MTLATIAGFVGDGAAGARATCGEIIGGLADFGKCPSYRTSNRAAFGAIGASNSLERTALFGNDRLLVAIDGRIDNAPELKRDLSLDQYLPPAELFACAWSKWGDDAPRRLIGEFAAAVFDVSTRRLWLARDPSGYRPLFYREGAQGVAFATMASGLAAVKDCVPDFARFATYVDGDPFEGGWAFWKDIAQVPPGSLLCFDRGARTEQRLLDRGAIAVRAPHWSELVEELRERLDRAVERNLAGCGPVVGAHLSSGLDSSAVVSSAAFQLEPGQQLFALTAAPAEDSRILVPRGRFADESSLAAQSAAMAGANHCVVRDSSPLFEAVRGTAHLLQQPAPSQFSFPWLLELDRSLIEAGGRVMLTGAFGNLTLSYGGLPALGTYLERGRPVDWLREAMLVSRREDVRVRGIVYNSLERWLPRRLSDRLWRAGVGLPSQSRSFVRPEWRFCSGGQLPSHEGELAGRLTAIRNSDPGNAKRGMLALTGVESRDPLADRELIEFCLSLPPEAHLRGGRIKALLREALAGRVPGEVLDNRRRGVSGTDWYDRLGPADCRAALEEVRASNSADELLDLAALDRAIDHWPAFAPDRAAELGEFGWRIGRALTTGLFLAEIDRYPLGIARQ